MRCILPVLLLTCLPAAAIPTAADLARQFEQIGLDPGECYRVVEQNLSRGDLRIYFNSGYLIFAKPVNGVRTGAVFTAETEGGDGELLLLPPVRSERLSLLDFTGSPNLDEHFRSALLLFTDHTASDLLEALQTNGAKKVPEMGEMLSERWDPILRNVDSSFQVRLVADVLGGEPKNGFFFMTINGTKLGNFDLLYDPSSDEDTLVGQVGERNKQNYFNVWTSFASRTKRNSAKILHSAIQLDNYRIEAAFDSDLSIKAVTKVTVTPSQRCRAVAFLISPQMNVVEAKVDGQPAEVYQHESLRQKLLAGTEDQEFLVVPPVPLEPGQSHEFEIHHSGLVISKAGDQVYYVGARATWYPRRGFEFAHYNLTFRYPKQLDFVATGDLVEDRTEGDSRITRRTSAVPIRFAAFNLGDYKSISISHEPYRIDVYANRQLENALRTRPGPPIVVPDPLWVRHHATTTLDRGSAPPASASSGLEALARDVASAFDFMVAQFGPPATKTLTVSPIPGSFGQGFPGLLYLSTLAYLDPAQRPASARDRLQQTFFSDLLDAHEVAHQWWGNLVSTSSYQDQWLMEALAHYSALMYLEKKKNAHEVDTILDDFRDHLLEKGPSGHSWESSGPIIWGYRLQTSQAPDAWHRIEYEKGAWVIHMLRRKMGDDRFLAMLRAMCKRYHYQNITTGEFRALAAEYMPPHSQDADLTNFFENWVYGTGIPAIKMNYQVQGLKVTGTTTESEVGDDFTALIPIEVQTAREKKLYWVSASTDAIPFSIRLDAPPTKVAVALEDALVTLKK